MSRLKYYICDNCHFQFERAGECEQCPDCGKEQVRLATEPEIEVYLKIKAEIEKAKRKTE